MKTRILKVFGIMAVLGLPVFSGHATNPCIEGGPYRPHDPAVRRRGRRRSDDEIVAAIELLAATEGIVGETAVGVALATTRKLLNSGQLDPGAETVIINSGDGLKTLDAVARSISAVSPIRPTLRAFTEFESSVLPRKAAVA